MKNICGIVQGIHCLVTRVLPLKSLENAHLIEKLVEINTPGPL